MPGKRILIIPFELMSHYLRCIVLAECYKGDEVYFAASKNYKTFIEKAGYKTVNVLHFDSQKVMAYAKDFKFDWLNQTDIESVLNDQVRAIGELKPDLVIGDTSPTLKMASEITKTPYTALMNGYMSKYFDGVRHVSHTHYSYKFLSELPPHIASAITVFAEKVAFRIIHKPFKKARKKFRLKYVNNYLDELEGDENLLCDDPDLFPQKRLPGDYRVIGPLYYAQTDSESELLSQLDPGKPSVCICMGSSGDLRELFFLSSPEYSHINFIIAGYANNLQAPHIFQKDFINLSAVLPHCKLLICHGGNGTIYEGIRHKLPILCLTSLFEQEWNVQMLEKFGLGKSINHAPQVEIDAALSLLVRWLSDRSK